MSDIGASITAPTVEPTLLPVAAGQSGKTLRTTCPYCGVGCGILATKRADGGVAIAGDPAHPANFGRLCSKGMALAETLDLDGRILRPEIAGRPVEWDEALDTIAQRFSAAIAEHGPESVAFYVSGQLLTEDYYVANKLMKGFIGTANIDTNSRLCMASSVAGHKRAFGADTVPGCYEDLDESDLVVLVGSNLAWCHPILFRRIEAARAARGTKVVVVDPRRTATCEIADMHLALAPGSDVALFNGLLMHIVGANAVDHGYVSKHTSGFGDAIRAARDISTRMIAGETGISQLDLFRFYDLFIGTRRVVTVYSQGVNQSASGTDKVNAIINCHLATGRIGRPGMGPFSVTGQPNAMGGRETGGLANTLAAHMDLDNDGHRRIVKRFWRAPRIADKPGLKAVDMFRAVGDGRIKALWIMATNPVDSMPDADAVREAIKSCPFVVVSDMTRHTDTAALADVLLPSLAWGEKSGTVTNSERRISRQRAFVRGPRHARADWWQLAEVARRLGYGRQFAWKGPHEIFAEYAALTAQGNDGTRDLDIGAFAKSSRKSYDEMEPFQWPRSAGQPAGEARFFADGGFFTPDRKARFVATTWKPPSASVTPGFPLVLNTGRIRDQWHTMTRTSQAPRLMAHIAEPFVELHSADAGAAGVAPADLARIVSANGAAVARVAVTDRQRRGSIFMSMHWTDQHASAARVDALTSSIVDPISGQPELKRTPVRVEPYLAAWFGFAVACARPTPSGLDYWAVAPAKAGWRIEIAGLEGIGDGEEILHRLLAGARKAHADIVAYHDAASRQHRYAMFNGAELDAVLVIGPKPVAASRDYLVSKLGTTFPDAAARFGLLATRPPADRADPGPLVCCCFEVGRNDIRAALASPACRSVDAVGAATRAGTNCGSCRGEIERIVRSERVAELA